MENYHHYQHPQPSSFSPTSSPWVVSGDQNSSSSTPHHHHHRYQPTEETIMRSRPGSSTGKRLGAAGVKLSTDPQSVAARERRHRISDRFRVLKSLVPGGSKMDTVSMLEEAINYVKFLKTQIWLHQAAMTMLPPPPPPPPHDHMQELNVNVPFEDCTSNAALLPQLDQEDLQLLGYNYATAAAASPTLAPFPYCSFQGDQEEMLPPVTTFNY